MSKQRPFKLIPAYKDYLWGGTKLKEEYGKSTPLAIVAESWELSAHADGQSIIEGGSFNGIPFGEYIAQNPQAAGSRYSPEAAFPILIKFIDAKQSLSIQVHPNDEYAMRVEKEAGKTEMWIVLECEDDAFLYFGFEHEITKQEMQQRIENNTITDVLHKQYVKKGDVIFIPAGTIHAIGKGILLAEIQQNSNSTYRVYDFGRVGADGKPRELHLQKALDVTSTVPAANIAPGAQLLQKEAAFTHERLAKCEYFTTDRLLLNSSFIIEQNSQSFIALLCTSGSATLEAENQSLDINKGDCVFIPANSAEQTLKGNGEFLLASL